MNRVYDVVHRWRYSTNKRLLNKQWEKATQQTRKATQQTTKATQQTTKKLLNKQGKAIQQTRKATQQTARTHNVTSKYYPVLVPGGRGDGISQGREHARGASTPGARSHQDWCIVKCLIRYGLNISQHKKLLNKQQKATQQTRKATQQTRKATQQTRKKLPNKQATVCWEAFCLLSSLVAWSMLLLWKLLCHWPFEVFM